MSHWNNLLPIETDRMLNNTHVKFIDVREPDEFLEGRIPGAVIIPLNELSPQISVS